MIHTFMGEIVSIFTRERESRLDLLVRHRWFDFYRQIWILFRVYAKEMLFAH